MPEKKSWDHLKILTKDEIIAFLKENYTFSPPLMKDIKYKKWYERARILLQKHKDHIKKCENSNLIRRINENSEEIGSCNNLGEKVVLFKNRQILLEELQNQQDEYDKISKAMKKNDSFYYGK